MQSPGDIHIGFCTSGDALRSYSACRNAVTPARRRCCCVRLLEAVGRRDLGPGLGVAVRGSAAHEFPDEGAWQADVGGRGGVGDELCRGALHGRFGGPDAWLKALPDHQQATKSSTTRQYERPATAGGSSRRHRRARTRGPVPAHRRINRTQALKIRACHKIRSRTRASGPAPGSALSRPARS